MKASREQTKGLTSSGNVEILLFSCIGEAKDNKSNPGPFLYPIISCIARIIRFDLIRQTSHQS